MTRAYRRLARSAAVTMHLALAVVLVGLWLLPLRCLPDRRLATRHRQRLVRRWMRGLLHVLGVQLKIRGEAIPAPALIVANHVSWLDIPCLLAAQDIRFVAKDDIARWPLIGWLAGGIGTLFLARGSGTRLVADGMTFALVAGERVAVFPEGTSTDGRGVLPFHARLYQAAIRAAVPVQAVAIRYPLVPDGTNPRVPFVGDDRFIRHLWRLLGEREIVAQLDFCPPLASTAVARRDLARQSRNQIVGALANGRQLHDSPNPAVAGRQR